MNYRYKIITMLLLVYSCITCAWSAEKASARVALDLRDTMELDQVVSKISSARVVYVGETHDSYADHLTQLEIIKRLHAENPSIAIGMEQFQQPFQDVLDRYIRGELDEKGLIRNSEWMERWRFDYRLYRPILTFARDNRIPVIALNIPKEIVAQVSEKGIDGLSEDEMKQIPSEIDDSDQEYRKRLKKIYEGHAHKGKNGFEGFMQVQLLWDESMADRAAEYLRANPERQLIVLAGAGHLMYGSGIPQRVSRRVEGERYIILPTGETPIDPEAGDFLVHGAGEQLPQAGVLGLMLDDSADGVVVKDIISESAAAKAGVEKDDLIRSVNGMPVKDVVDLKLMLMDKYPEYTVDLVLLRRNIIRNDVELNLIFQLGK